MLLKQTLKFFQNKYKFKTKYQKNKTGIRKSIKGNCNYNGKK